MISRPSLRLTAIPVLIIASSFAVPAALAQDGQAVDVGQMLQQLHQLREQQTTQIKAQKQSALQQVNAAAGSVERAVALWEDAVRTTQFDGVSKEATAFRNWREGEGEALKEHEAQNAVRLYFEWLSLTLQRSSGAKVKDLLPSIINYTKELAADQAAMENLDDTIKRERERAADKRGGGRKNNDADVKKMHDSILHRGLGGSVVVQAMKLGDYVNVERWEQTPGNFDGIFEKIVLPELRLERDARVLEYWDTKIKREADAASKSKLDFERDKFNTVRLPNLLWRKAVDMSVLGFKNRAATEMFTLIKKYPTHPDASEWMSKLEEMLMPAAPATAPAPVAPAAAPVPVPAPAPAPAPALLPVPVTPSAPASGAQ
jgi:hypothetical protein